MIHNILVWCKILGACDLVLYMSETCSIIGAINAHVDDIDLCPNHMFYFLYYYWAACEL